MGIMNGGHSRTTYRTIIKSLPLSSATIILSLSINILLLSCIFLYRFDHFNLNTVFLCPSNLITTTSFQNQTHDEFPLICPNITSQVQACPKENSYPSKFKPRLPQSPPETCPDYFRWMYEDLAPWITTGITSEMIERGKDHGAHFRVLIVNGKLYVEKYRDAFQTRDVFSIWGILQLLRLYPGEVPDLELLFSCDDRPAVDKSRYRGVNATTPPPIFIYSGNDQGYGILFPDWSFWGWPEVKVSPWESMLKKIKEESKKTKWKDRELYAYWKGNPKVAWTRIELMKCNLSQKFDWNARLYFQAISSHFNWISEGKEGFKNSKLEDQCTHRYKIYIEGNAWSVSEKYILACDSMTLFVKLNYFDFFTRSLEPMKHFWPIRSTDKCRDIKFAVEWGNNHTDKAQAIGDDGTRFTEEQLKMGYVYDYMLHVLKEYAKLLKFKPKMNPSEGLTEVCIETMACHRNGIDREYLEETLVKYPSDSVPCNMPPRLDPVELQDFVENQENVYRKVESWEREYSKS
ncbi:hypothetical protein ACFE04_017966 [Oxalis oulophora]